MNDATLSFGEMADQIFAVLQTGRAKGERAVPVVVVTSAVAGEGTSFVAEGLALHLAALSIRRVVLVDANFARPSATTRFKATGRAGLMELLRSEIEASADAPEPVATDLDNLTVLGIGRAKPEAALLFRDGARGRLYAWAAQKCDLLILDAGPLLEPGASKLIDGAMQAVLVVDSRRTARRTVASALALSGAGPQAWGVVLNRSGRMALRERA